MDQRSADENTDTAAHANGQNQTGPNSTGPNSQDHNWTSPAPPQTVRSQNAAVSNPVNAYPAYTTDAPPLPDNSVGVPSNQQFTQMESGESHDEFAQPIDTPLDASQLRIGVAIIVGVVFLITSTAVVALVAVRVWQDRDSLVAENSGISPPGNQPGSDNLLPFGRNDGANDRGESQPRTAARKSSIPRIKTTAGYKSYTWRHNNQLLHFEYISQGNLVSDLQLIVREFNGNPNFPNSVSDASQRLDGLKVSDLKQNLERTLIYAWLVHQPTDEKYRESIAQHLVDSRKKFPFYHDVVVRCFLDWGTNDLAPAVWDSDLKNEGTLLLSLAERFPSEKMIKLLKSSSTGSSKLRKAWLNSLKQTPPADPFDVPDGLSKNEIQQLYHAWGLTDEHIQFLNQIKQRDFSQLRNAELPDALVPKIQSAIRNPRPSSNQEAWWICLGRFGEAEDLSFLKSEVIELKKHPAWAEHAMQFAIRHDSQIAAESVVHIMDALADEHKNQMRARTLKWERMGLVIPNLKLFLTQSVPLRTTVSQHAKSRVGNFGNGDFWLAVLLDCGPSNEDLQQATQEFAEGEAGISVEFYNRLKSHLNNDEQANCQILGKLLTTEYGREQVELWEESMSNLTEVPTKKAIEAAIEPFLLHSNRKAELRKLWSCFGEQLEPCLQLLLDTSDDDQFEMACQALSTHGTKDSLPILRAELKRYQDTARPTRAKMIRYAGQQISRRDEN